MRRDKLTLSYVYVPTLPHFEKAVQNGKIIQCRFESSDRQTNASKNSTVPTAMVAAEKSTTTAVNGTSTAARAQRKHHKHGRKSRAQNSNKNKTGTKNKVRYVRSRARLRRSSPVDVFRLEIIVGYKFLYYRYENNFETQIRYKKKKVKELYVHYQKNPRKALTTNIVLNVFEIKSVHCEKIFL